MRPSGASYSLLIRANHHLHQFHRLVMPRENRVAEWERGMLPTGMATTTSDGCRTLTRASVITCFQRRYRMRLAPGAI